ncbi:hybrid sensor histidine kinase/response regulator transcription factor [Pedobacter nanyangensis]|uniref:hybrid sensor histidine kinase/response regulator transcription factor n=1 Tax=Pedobacter nanyangensis TaxID=1562389 RepID=UPI000DE41C80|nr:two-component regulator propeller domain-containing protein [Pedobacter nanyangensis]
MKYISIILSLLFFGLHTCVAQPPIFDHLVAENGLSQNSVFAITQDSRGFMWYGSRFGLNRYDGSKFKLYRSSASDTTSISDDYVTTLYSDTQKRLWVGTANGLNHFDPQRSTFKRIYLKTGRNYAVNGIRAVYEDKQKRLWIGSTRGLYLLTNPSCLSFTWAGKLGLPSELAGSEILCVHEDLKGYLWVGTANKLFRCRFNSKIYDIEIFQHTSSPSSISYNAVTDIVEDRSKNLWFATENGGLNLFDDKSKTFTRFLHHNNNNSLVHNAIRKMIRKSTGEIWIGTQEGLSILNPETKTFQTIQHRKSRPKSLNQNSIYSIFEDRNGSMWVGTYYGGVNVNYASPTNFKTLQYNEQPEGISHNVVSSIIAANGNNLWIATEGGGLNYLDWQSRKCKHYYDNPNDSQHIGSDLIKILYKDTDGNIWIGTHGGGLNVMNPETGKVTHFFTGQDKLNGTRSEIVALLEAGNGTFWVGSQTGLRIFDKKGIQLSPNSSVKVLAKFSDKNIKVLFKDANGNIWIAATTGLYRYAPTTGKLNRYTLPKGSNSASPNFNYINCIQQDSRKNIWIGLYYGGLSKYNAKRDMFLQPFTTKNGLSNNNVLGILEDQKHQLWISTSNGLSKFNPSNLTFQTYTTSDGLAGDEFNYNSFFISKRGEFFFGGYNGLTYFFPDEIQKNNYKAPLVFTQLKLSNVPVKINAPDGLLQQDISFTKKLVFKYDQNIFTVEFALLNYIKSTKNRYAYKLEGINKQWIETTIPSANYTNLPSGTYKLLVKGANNDGLWSSPASIHIEILPPFWKTWWAFCIYAVLIAIVLFFITRFFYLRELLIKDEELHQNKLNFFTNVSHEIRTHLTLIMAPIERMLDISQHTPQFKKESLNLKNNAERLLRLVSELMDFRKVETKHLKLRIAAHDLVDFIRNIFSLFEALSEKKQIHYSLKYEQQPIIAYFDKEQLEKVFFNLISNAFKFTPKGGHISIALKTLSNQVFVSITDTGRGIAPQHLDRLFTNFFQVNDHNIQNTGYGIGLALSKHIAELHKGNITVNSIPAQNNRQGYTNFTVTLQLGNKHFNNACYEALQDTVSESHEMNTSTAHGPIETTDTIENKKAKNYTILVVEDNAAIQQMVAESLEQDYHILTAKNGLSGWTRATEEVPDLVISDVMMPQMDGFTLCNKLKADQRTSHIPLILLTAKSSETDQISGLSGGADAYLTKPFSSKILQLHVQNLLNCRETMQQKFSRHLVLEPQQIAIAPVEEQFLSKLIHIIENNMENVHFGVEHLAEGIGMSQSVLYKKLKALTNMSVNDFAKSIRLKRAAQLLLQKKYTVYEIGYMVGFSDRKYFSRAFKKQFGKTPSEYVDTPSNKD